MSELMEQVKTSAEGDTPEIPSDTGVVENNWAWDDGVSGAGEKPEWLQEKFPTVAEQAKAYTEAQKLVSTSEVIDEVDLSTYADYFDLESQQINDLKEYAKKERIDNSKVNGIVDHIVKYQDAALPDANEEIEKLGKNGRQTMKSVDTWAKNNLSEESNKVVDRIINRAEDVKLFDEIRQKFSLSQSQAPTNVQNLADVKLDTIEGLDNEMKQPENYKRYNDDIDYRLEMDARYGQVCGKG